jgi:hypothetical protein
MRTRLRPGRGDAGELEFYSHRYPHGYMHRMWADHVERVAASVDFILRTSGLTELGECLVADLSCGDGAIAGGVRAAGINAHLFLGDLVDGGQADPVGAIDCIGPIDQTVFHLGRREDGNAADLVVCSETLEHLDDPEHVLRLLRERTDRLFVSTPLGEDDDRNPEHYWGWDTEGVHDLLVDCGFRPVAQETFTPQFEGSDYTFQFWMCR